MFLTGSGSVSRWTVVGGWRPRICACAPQVADDTVEEPLGWGGVVQVVLEKHLHRRSLLVHTKAGVGFGCVRGAEGGAKERGSDEEQPFIPGFTVQTATLVQPGAGSFNTGHPHEPWLERGTSSFPRPARASWPSGHCITVPHTRTAV